MKDTAEKVLYAAVGAPVLAGKATADAVRKLADGVRGQAGDFRRNVAGSAREQFDAAAKEGEQLTRKVRGSNVMEEISSRIDLDDIQGRVDKLRDQVEDALANWREQFRPETETATKTETAKVAKSTTKTAGAKKAPAKKAAAKTTAAKSTATKKAPAKKATAKKTETKKAS